MIASQRFCSFSVQQDSATVYQPVQNCVVDPLVLRSPRTTGTHHVGQGQRHGVRVRVWVGRDLGLRTG